MIELTLYLAGAIQVAALGAIFLKPQWLAATSLAVGLLIGVIAASGLFG